MPIPRLILCLALFLCTAPPAFLPATSGYADDQADVCPVARGAVIGDLPAALAKHESLVEERYDALLGASDRGQRPLIGRESSFCNVDMQGTDLRAVRLAYANLRGALLTRADLSGASLERSDLTGAKLRTAKLSRAWLLEARFRGADLRNADLREANLSKADLTGADLQGANLEGALLYRTVLTDAKLEDANLAGAQFEPRGLPSPEWLASLNGVSRVWFCEDEEGAMVRLRSLFREAGLRGLEREATFAIERHRTAYALASWDPNLENTCGRLKQDRWAAIEGVFRLVFFEWTTGYGLAYGRPILILLGLIGLFALVYLPALLIASARAEGSGIYRVWPAGRITQNGSKPVAADDVIVERLHPRGLSALGLALYFSLISAFHLGWRDLNVGTWLARIQPRDYALHGQGWVRVVAGIQSLISVYLIAMWGLTYFSRPFG